MKHLNGWILGALICSQLLSAQDKKPLNATQALDVLVERLTADSVYTGWTRMECLAFVLEDSSSSYFDIAVREKHGNGCPGDSIVNPIVDRFKVSRIGGRVSWWNAASETDDSYEPYSEFLRSRKQ